MPSEFVYNSMTNVVDTGMSFGMSLVMLLFYIGVFVLVYAIQWIVFRKAGEAGWKCLIPIYNVYILCRIAKRPKLFWKYIVSSILVIVASISFVISTTILVGASIFSQDSGSGLTIFFVSLFAMLILSIVLCIIQCVLYFNIGKAFGQCSLFGVGLILMTPIFMGIIAFSKDIQYVGYIDATNNNIGPSGPNYYGNNYQNPYNYNNQNNNFNNNQNNF